MQCEFIRLKLDAKNHVALICDVFNIALLLSVAVLQFPILGNYLFTFVL